MPAYDFLNIKRREFLHAGGALGSGRGFADYSRASAGEAQDRGHRLRPYWQHDRRVVGQIGPPGPVSGPAIQKS